MVRQRLTRSFGLESRLVVSGLLGNGLVVLGTFFLATLLILVPNPGEGVTQSTSKVNIKTAFGARCNGHSFDTKAFVKAAASGKDIYIPPGTCIVGKKIVLKPGADWRGAGKAHTSVRNYNPFQLSSDTSVSNLQVFSPAEKSNPMGTAFTVDNATGRSNAAVWNVRVKGFQKGIYVERPANGTTHHRMTFADNKFYNNRLAINAIKLDNSSIMRNTFVGQNAAIEFYGGSGNLISRNIVNGRTGAGGNPPRVGILFLANDKKVRSYGEARGNRITFNTVRNFTEEGISFDIRANEPWNTNIRDIDEVASVRTESGRVYVRLSSENWSSAPSGTYNGYLMTALTGSQTGNHFRIARHSRATFDVGPASVGDKRNPALYLQPGDQLAIGSPFVGNRIADNIVDASRGYVGIALHGYSFGARVLRNDVTAPSAASPPYASQGYPDPVGIRVTSMIGIADGRGPAKREDGSCNTMNDRNCDGDSLNDPGDAYAGNPFQRKAPSNNNEVSNNTVRGGDITFNLFNYTNNPDHAFVSYGNRADDNRFLDGGKLFVRHHKLTP